MNIDSLLTIPIQIQNHDNSLIISQNNILKSIIKISSTKYGKQLDRYDNILKGKRINKEYKNLVDESIKNENKKNMRLIGIMVSLTDKDKTKIYDSNLINNLKIKFKKFKTSLKEKHASSGLEFDEESYIDGYKPFFIDINTRLNTKIVILLDHSSSILKKQSEYKKAALALCEVLSYLRIKFSIYAFNTQEKSVIC